MRHAGIYISMTSITFIRNTNISPVWYYPDKMIEISMSVCEYNHHMGRFINLREKKEEDRQEQYDITYD